MPAATVNPATPATPLIETRPAPSRVLMFLAFLSIYLIWGSTYLAIRYAVETIPPLVTAGIRHLTAGSILLAFAWARGFRPSRQHWVSGTVLGALFFWIGHGTLHWAEQYVPSGLAALLVASEPMFILLLGSLLKQEKINWLNGLGLLVGLAGVAMLTGNGWTAARSSTLGITAILLGAFSWGVGVCISPRLKLPEDSVGRAAVPLLCGSVLLLGTAGATGEFAKLSWHAVSLRSEAGLAYLIVFGSVVAFTAYTWLLEHCSPTLVSTHTYANPVVAVLLGWLLASEQVSVRLLAAMVAILGAILLIRQGQRAYQQE